MTILRTTTKLKFWYRCGATFALALGGLLVACSDGSDGSASVDATDGRGRLHVALSTGVGGQFRLRQAVFDVRDVTGVTVLTLSSTDDPAEVALNADLPQGRYTAELAPGWVLEEALEDGGFRTLSGALVSANPREFRVRHGQVTDVAYSFATDTAVISLGRGGLSVGIAVVDPATLGSCSALEPQSCPGGLTCLLADDTGSTFCAQPGPLAVGEACEGEQCVAGAQCLRMEGESAGVCKRFCDPSAPDPICNCQSLSFDENLGVCEAPPSCEPDCSVQTFGFEETIGDDADGWALFDFFSALPATSETDYLFFEISSEGGGGAWCSSNANFYVDAYLNLSPTGGGMLESGAWEKYVRPANGDWSPQFASRPNYFGGACDSMQFSWCSEWSLGGEHLRVTPGSTNWESWADSGVGRSVRIVVGNSRASACGF
jgi:hypothetical protein